MCAGFEPLVRAREQRLHAREDRRRRLAGQLLVDDRLRQRQEQARRAIDPHAKRPDGVDEPRQRGVRVAQVRDRRDRDRIPAPPRSARAPPVPFRRVPSRSIDSRRSFVRDATVGRETAHAAIGGEHAVARHDQRERVLAQRLADGARRARLAEARRQVAVGELSARVRCSRADLVDAAMERRHLFHVERDRRRARWSRRAAGSGSDRRRAEPRRASAARCAAGSASAQPRARRRFGAVGQLDRRDSARAPGDAATSDRGIEERESWLGHVGGRA